MSPMPDEREWRLHPKAHTKRTSIAYGPTLSGQEVVAVVPKSTREAAEQELGDKKGRLLEMEETCSRLHERLEAAEAEVKRVLDLLERTRRFWEATASPPDEREVQSIIDDTNACLRARAALWNRKSEPTACPTCGGPLEGGTGSRCSLSNCPTNTMHIPSPREDA